MPFKDPAKRAIAARKSKYKKKYGITLEHYDEMLVEQGGICAICGTTDPGGSGARFAVDHCHTNGHVRGLLCQPCNTAIGLMKDDIGLLAKAINYLNEKSN